MTKKSHQYLWNRSHSPSEIYAISTHNAPTGFRPRFLGCPEACWLIGWASLSREFTSPRGRKWPPFGLINPLVELALSVKSPPVFLQYFLAVTLKWRYGQEQMHLLQTHGYPTVDKPTPINRPASQTSRPQSDSQFLCAKSEHVRNILYFCAASTELRDRSNLVKWWKLPIRTRI